MSTLATFFNTTAVLVRETTSSPTGGDTTTTVSSFAGVLRPVTEKSQLYQENNMGNEWDYVATVTDVNVADALYVNGSKYDVLGVAVYQDLEDGSDSYTNIRVTRSE